MPKRDTGRNHLDDYTCCLCGQIVSAYTAYDSKLRQKKHINTCFECSYWLYTADHPKDNFQVINNQYFTFPPTIKKGGRIRHILTIQGEIISSTEYYNYGTIPERFRNRFPSTANFINGALLRHLKANAGFKCRRLGCWDRQYCLWFNEEQKNWNRIPDNHIIGDENCPMFINKFNPND